VVRPCSRLNMKEPVSRHGRAHVAGRQPSGAGTSMLGRRLATILPAMTLAEAMETTRIHRVAGLIGGRLKASC
jgi:predicted ATPase with chaperone activity